MENSKTILKNRNYKINRMMSKNTQHVSSIHDLFVRLIEEMEIQQTGVQVRLNVRDVVHDGIQISHTGRWLRGEKR